MDCFIDSRFLRGFIKMYEAYDVVDGDFEEEKEEEPIILQELIIKF